ncbi:Uncharacterised protein [uncultured archaeon]|nr:Uncharacterised protein [uncultured archaeon]
MLIGKGRRKKEQLQKKAIVWDYPMPSEDIGFAVQELNGRVPDSGWMRNKICNELCFVIKGKGIVFVESEKYEINEGDVFIISPGKKSYIVANGLKILAVTSPNWYAEQCESVE